jgi:hypothetical protein
MLAWREAELSLIFKNAKSAKVTLRARGVSELNVPLGHPWGPSVSVNEIIGPQEVENENRKLTIEMQSGDKITIVAKFFEFPE